MSFSVLNLLLRGWFIAMSEWKQRDAAHTFNGKCRCLNMECKWNDRSVDFRIDMCKSTHKRKTAIQWAHDTSLAAHRKIINYRHRHFSWMESKKVKHTADRANGANQTISAPNAMYTMTFWSALLRVSLAANSAFGGKWSAFFSYSFRLMQKYALYKLINCILFANIMSLFFAFEQSYKYARNSATKNDNQKRHSFRINNNSESLFGGDKLCVCENAREGNI